MNNLQEEHKCLQMRIFEFMSAVTTCICVVWSLLLAETGKCAVHLFNITWAVVLIVWYNLVGDNSAKNEPRVSLGERQVSKALAILYPGHKFVKVRPDWLKNPETGRNLELDFYNEALKLAVEFNGIQHYAFTAKFHSQDRDAFHLQMHRDRLKAKLCAKHGVHLVIVRHDDTDILHTLKSSTQTAI